MIVTKSYYTITQDVYQTLEVVNYANVRKITGYMLIKAIDNDSEVNQYGLTVKADDVRYNTGGALGVSGAFYGAYLNGQTVEPVIFSSYGAPSHVLTTYHWLRVVYDFEDMTMSIAVSEDGLSTADKYISDAKSQTYSAINQTVQNIYLDDNVVELGQLNSNIIDIVAVHFELDIDVTEGGTVTVPRYDSVNIKSSVGAYGIASIQGRSSSISSAMVDEMRKYITFAPEFNNPYTLFQGELIDINLSISRFEFIFYEETRKFMNMLCNHNPVLESGSIEYIGLDTSGNVILKDHKKDFSSYSSRIVTCRQNSSSYVVAPVLQRVIYSPNRDTNPTTYNVCGSIDNIYFDDIDLDETDNILSYKIPDDSNPYIDWGLELTFYMYFKVGVTPSEMLVHVIDAFRIFENYLGANNNPRIALWDFQASTPAYQEIYTITDDDIGGNSAQDGEDCWSLDKSPYYTYRLNVDDLTHYIAQQTFETESERINKNRFKILILPGMYKSLSFSDDPTHHVKKALLEFSVSDRDSTESTASVSSASVDTLTLAAIGSRALFDDGICIGDTFYITKTAKETAEDIFSNIDNWDVVITVSDAETHAITKDYTEVSVYQFLQDFAEQFNAVWWADFDDRVIYISDTAHLTDSGVTLTENDIYNYFDNSLHINISSSNLRSKIVANGEDVSVTSDDLIPAYTLSLGDETELISRPDLDTVSELNDIIDNASSRYINLTYDISFPVFANDFDELRKAELYTLNIKNPYGQTIINGSFMLYAIDLENSKNTGYRDILYLHFQKRL